jgi:alkylated DNA repair dioxygenase AlkB
MGPAGGPVNGEGDMSAHIDLADGGTIVFTPHFLAPDEADRLFEALKQAVPWRQEKTSWGNPFPRLTAWYADPGLTYSYSGVTHHALAWTAELSAVRRRVEEPARAPFNSLLLNYYRDGQDSIGFHSDAEPELGTNPVVPSVSLGATRTFVLKHDRTGERRTFELTHGSLLLMGGTLQHHWKHALPKAKGEVGERINLTFRNILRPGDR